MKKYFVLILFLLVAVLFAANGQVVITQIMYDSPLNEQVTITPYSNGEFIELYNMGEENIDISQWILLGDGVTEKYVFPSGTTIQSCHHLIVAYCHKKSPEFVLSSLYDVDTTSIVYQNKVVLKNAGEAVRLHNQHGILVDSIYFDGTSHKTKPNRLSAENADSIAGNLCKSLKRKYVTYDAYGCVIVDNLHWETQYVSMGTIIPEIQPYIADGFYWEEDEGISSGRNYVVTVNPLDECSNISLEENGRISMSDGCRAQVSITHINELGQVVQTTLKSASPEGEDIVSYTEYNPSTRSINNWLPIVADGTNPLAISDIQSLATNQYADISPYSTTTKELSHRGRVERITQAGEVYQNHSSHMEYDVNSTSMPHIVVVDSGLRVEGEYPIGVLRKTTMIDADGKKQSTFVDMDERTIIARLGDDLDTYYVYDDFGRLRYVLPPAITRQMNGNSIFKDSDELIRNYAYVYKYDKRGNQIYKRLPGAEHIYMVYDKVGHLVLQQDGNQRERGNIWLMTKYDAYGRNIYSLECDMQEWDYSSLLDTISDIQFTEHYSATSTTSMLGSTGYTNTRLVMPNSKVLVVNYYDDYDFLNLLPEEKASMLRYENKQGYGQQYENATGLATGTISYNLSDEQYTIATSYYDVYGNIIQVCNTTMQGGSQVAYTAYHFDGTKSKLLLEYNNDVVNQEEKYTYLYDHVGRPTVTTYQLNNNPAIVQTQLIYNQRGQLSQRLRYNGQDTTMYQYTTHGALSALLNEHFSEYLFYADSLLNDAVACYNGNISAMNICLGDSLYYFAYYYDQYNRLHKSSFLTNDGLQPNECFDFDAMGNLMGLQRYTLQNRLLDDLSFALNGNQVISITDNAQATDLYNTKEYYDRCSEENMPDMQYDANGNLTRDLDRTIDTIRYNMYNLPDTVVFANGNKIINHYNASGNKWKTEYHTIIDAMYLPNTADGTVFEGTLADIHYTIYDGNIEYKYIVNSMGVDSLYEWVANNTEGYIACHPQNNTMTHYYYHQDHLGNICAVWDATHDSIVQQTLYYASGLPVSVSTGQDVQPYKYNGKEFVEMHGYDVYEYGARGYYATIGRFTSIDPLCEQTPWQSPYVYANNNWVNNIDWMGMSADGFHVPTLNWVAVDKDGNVQGFDLFSDDKHVYLVDDNWDGTYEGLEGYEIIGRQHKKQRIYIIGEPCYYIGYYQTSSIVNGEFVVTAGERLMYGSKPAPKSIDTTWDGAWHYVFHSDKTPVAIGGPNTFSKFLSHPTFISKRQQIMSGIAPANDTFPINMRNHVYHIGRTNVAYTSKDGYIVFILGVEDGFWDVNVAKEWLSVKIYGINPSDGMGDNLEVLGTPYPYIPMIVKVPNSY